MTQNKPGSIVALTAQMQQILVQAQRQIEFAADHVIATIAHRESEGTPRENPAAPTTLVRGHRPARFRRGEAFDGSQHRAQRTRKIRAPVAGVRGVWQQRQLVQPFLKLRGRFRHRRAGGGSPAGLAPVRRRIFQRARPPHNAARRARAGSPSARGNGLRALRRSARAIAAGHCATGCRAPRPAPARA